MKNFKKIVSGLIALAIFSFIPLKSNAQLDPLCDPLCNCYPDGVLCPIDDGVYLLIAAGIGLAALKAFKNKRKNSVSL